jgi:hypothetical protein
MVSTFCHLILALHAILNMMMIQWVHLHSHSLPSSYSYCSRSLTAYQQHKILQGSYNIQRVTQRSKICNSLDCKVLQSEWEGTQYLNHPPIPNVQMCNLTYALYSRCDILHSYQTLIFYGSCLRQTHWFLCLPSALNLSICWLKS